MIKVQSIKQSLRAYKHQQRSLIKGGHALLLSLSVFAIFVSFMLDIAQAERRQFKLHWNASNPIFRIDNTDNVFDINKGNAPWEHDQVDIMCPFYEPNSPPPPKSEEEKYIIYNVNKEEFESCRIHNSMPR